MDEKISEAVFDAGILKRSLSKRTSNLFENSTKDRIKSVESFVSSIDLQLAASADAILEAEVFADVLRYAFDVIGVSQVDLAHRISYANSQVGRWAAAGAVPPILVRKVVLKEVSNMCGSILVELNRMIEIPANSNSGTSTRHPMPRTAARSKASRNTRRPNHMAKEFA